jgi:hypothetical protein
VKRRITTLVASGFLALASPAMAVDLAKGLNKKQIEDRTGVKLQCSDLISLDDNFIRGQQPLLGVAGAVAAVLTRQPP